MNIIQRIEQYGDTHHPKWLDIVRITLGLVLTVKGIQFLGDRFALQQIIENSGFPWMSLFIVHYVGMAHVAGGPMIALGLATRIAALFQIPILVGAVVFVHSWRGLFVSGSELLFAVIVLLLLVFFLIYGSGPLSLDEWFKRHKQ
ncbi:MAG TPA: DoxX family protein [Chitinophagales bacterium]|nr:DoxX family protein [Chitinophagales bacterium]